MTWAMPPELHSFAMRLGTHERNKAKAASVLHAHRKRLGTPGDCESCGDDATVWHHYDYTRPLDVIPLCGSCHASIHKSGLPEPRTGRIYRTPRAFHPDWEEYDQAVLVEVCHLLRAQGVTARAIPSGLMDRAQVPYYDECKILGVHRERQRLRWLTRRSWRASVRSCAMGSMPVSLSDA